MNGGEQVRPFWWALTVLLAPWLLWMTLRPNQSMAADLSPLAAQAAERGISPRTLIGLMGNIIVFAPLGATLALAESDKLINQRLLLATLGGAFLSLTIELLQMLIPSRVTALDDWLLNTIGTALGALASLLLTTESFSRRTR